MLILDNEKLTISLHSATVITVGNFDGVHAGHQELIKRTVAEARAKKLTSVVVTFQPHPGAYFRPETIPSAICSKEYKEQLIASLGVDALLTLKFDQTLANLEAEEYVKQILLEKLQAKVICIGYDFTFGRQRTGSVRLLIELGEKYGFQTLVLGPQRVAGIVVSSTKIRECLLQGKVELAAKMLKRRHVIRGRVIPGDQLGRRLGFPTINISVKEGLIPKAGIYSGVVLTNNIEYPAAIYLGTRPTYQKEDFRVEAHLLGFAGDLYDSMVKLAFLRYQREETIFENSEQLRQVIQSDCQQAQEDFQDYVANNQGLPIIW